MVQQYEEPFDDDTYVPDEEEQREINDILSKEEEQEQEEKRPKNRIYHIFASEDHWAGWLKTNGIRW